MTDRTVLITGASGLTGSAVTRTMSEAGWTVRLFSRSEPRLEGEWIEGDILDIDALHDAVAGCSVVVHTAALHGRTWRAAGDAQAFRVNVDGTMHVLTAAMAATTKRVVFTSSIWAAGHGEDAPYLPIDEALPRQPRELYGLTKLLGESMCRFASSRSGIETICLRVGSIKTPEVSATNPAGFLFGAVDVRDVAQAHLLAAEADLGVAHDVFIITAGSPLAAITHDQYRADPITSAGSVDPRLAQLANSGALELPPTAEYYSIDHAGTAIGFRPRFGFDPTGT